MAAPDRVKADLDVLQGVAGKLANDYGQLQQTITTLQNESQMHAATWSGEARNAWDTAMEGVNTAWTKLNGVLDEITSNITTSGGQYGDTDTSNASGYKNVPTTDITSALNH